MRREKWERFLESISRQLPVSLIANENADGLKGSFVEADGSLPVLEAIDLLEKHDYLRLPDGRIVEKRLLLKRPLRIALFVILTELESRLYRTQEWSNRPLKELNDKNLNDLIKDLVNDKILFAYQTAYKKRSEFKEDLKAVSSMRNQIAHVNKKLEMEVDFETVLKRKRQMLRLLDALDEILARQERVRANG